MAEEDELTTTGWFTESSLAHSTWPKELWRMFRKNDQDAETDSSWEVALYRLTQLLSLILDIPATEVNHIISGTTLDVIEFYGAMLNELGGSVDGRFFPMAHYGLKQVDQYLSNENASQRASEFGAGDIYYSWVMSMGKNTDHEFYRAEVLTYEDVAGSRWPELWMPASRPKPHRVLFWELHCSSDIR